MYVWWSKNGPKPDLPHMVETQGLEPWTPCLQSRCSSQLSYVPLGVCHADLNHFSAVLPLWQDRYRRLRLDVSWAGIAISDRRDVIERETSQDDRDDDDEQCGFAARIFRLHTTLV